MGKTRSLKKRKLNEKGTAKKVPGTRRSERLRNKLRGRNGNGFKNALDVAVEHENCPDLVPLLTTLPEEVRERPPIFVQSNSYMKLWLLVFHRVKDPDDLLNCSKASPVFQGMLEQNKNVYLFPQVLGILDKFSHLDYCPTNNYSFSQDVLKCRLVCFGWKLGVDRFLEIRPYHFKFSLDDDHVRYKNPVAKMHRTALSDPAFDTILHLYDFSLDKLETCILPAISSPYYQHYSPSPSRHLNLYESEVVEDQGVACLEAYRQATLRFLAKVGQHFWHLSIEIHAPINHWLGCQLLVKYLHLLPNLKSLMWTRKLKFGVKEGNYNQPLTWMPEQQFPVLRNLRLVRTECVPQDVVSALLAAYKTAKVAEIIPHWSEKPCVEHRKTCMGGCLVDPNKLAISVTNFIDFLALPNNWNLTVLRLQFYHLDFQSRRWPNVCKKLECYKDTLTELSLRLPWLPESQVGTTWDSSQSPLNLPNLKRFHITHLYSCSIDFLLGLHSLQYLSLTNFRVITPNIIEGATRSALINIQHCLPHSFMSCNVWKLIPSLEEVDLSFVLPSGYYKRKYKRKLLSFGIDF